MATIGDNSKSFLRSSVYEVSEPFDEEDFFKKLLKKNQYGLIRKKNNILELTKKKGIQFRMVFNAMNMRDLPREEIQEHLKDISEELNDLGVSGIVEFHNADGTQNSDHIHLWVSSEDKIIYNRVAHYLVDNALSNKEDVHIQKFQVNGKIEEEFLYTENIEKESEENYADEETRKHIDDDYIKAEKHLKFKEESSDERNRRDVHIPSVQTVFAGEHQARGIHRNLLPTLPNGSLADSRGEGQYSLLLPFDEKGELQFDRAGDTILRLQGDFNQANEGAAEREKLAKLYNSLFARITKLKTILKGDNEMSGNDKKIQENIPKIFEQLDKDTSSLYKELYGIKDSSESKVNSSDDDGYLFIKELRREQAQIMRQR